MKEEYYDMPSPAFSSFRETMDTWDHYCYLRENIEDYLNQNQMIIFFKKNDEIFGSPEHSRITFAKLKNKEEPESHDDAKFIATNLIQSLMGDHPVNNMFGAEDIPHLNVCDRDEVINLLIQQQKKKGKDKKKDKK